MSYDDGRERFLQAVRILADERERIKERLLIAYASQLSRVNAQQDLPDEVMDEFYELRNALSDAEVPYGYGERAATKVAHMDEGEASALADKIFSIFLIINERTSQHAT